MIYTKQSSGVSPLTSKPVLHKEQVLQFSVPKGTAITKQFSNFTAIAGYTRHPIVKYISGTGSDAAIVNLKNINEMTNCTVCHLWQDANITVVGACIYLPD